MSEAHCVTLTTTGSRDEAQRLADILVSRRLAACVQILDIASTYTWKEELLHDNEHLLLIKTSARLYERVEAAILEIHSYEVPEIVQLPIGRGLAGYLNWITDNTG
jgi:periplasmic divalent cation tolerance protein